MKIGMIGAGRVGSAALLSVFMRGCAREIVVVNRDRKLARGVATNMQYGAPLSSMVDIRDGDYSGLTCAALVMSSAVANEQAGEVEPTGRTAQGSHLMVIV